MADLSEVEKLAERTEHEAWNWDTQSSMHKHLLDIAKELRELARTQVSKGNEG